MKTDARGLADLPQLSEPPPLPEQLKLHLSSQLLPLSNYSPTRKRNLESELEVIVRLLLGAVTRCVTWGIRDPSWRKLSSGKSGQKERRS